MNFTIVINQIKIVFFILLSKIIYQFKLFIINFKKLISDSDFAR